MGQEASNSVTTRVINLFAGPGAGKSTTAAGLFNLMKLSGEKVELVSEYAKDLTYERNASRLGNQMAILGEQFNRLYRLVDQVDWIITDSPLLLSMMYATGPFKSAGFTGTVMWAFEQFDNVNFVLKRTKEYQPYGRNQTEDEAKQVDLRVNAMLDGMGIEYTPVMGTEKAPYKIYEYVRNGAPWTPPHDHNWPVNGANEDWTGSKFQVRLPNRRWLLTPTAKSFDEAVLVAQQAWSDGVRGNA